MSPNSILFFTYWYPNKNNKSFGIFVKRHVQSVNIDNNPVVLSLNITKGKAFFKKNKLVFTDENGVETHQITLVSRFYKVLYILLPFHYFLLKNYIKRELLTKHTFEILHSNIIFPCGIVGNRLARKFNLKHVISEHWTKLDKFFTVNAYAFFGKQALHKANAITCVSKQLEGTLKKYTTNSSLVIIPNVIESNEFYFDPSIVKNAVFTFIGVANWAQHKNPFYFLNALNELVIEKKLGPFKLVLIGEGEQLNRIKEKNYLFNIEYKGILSGSEICTELNKSHVFLHGSDFETFSVVMAEALMCGLPCVLSPVGIANDVINDQNGFVTNNTHADWKEKIVKSYQAKYDSKLISDQLKNKFDLKTIASLFNKLYASL